MNTSLIVLLDEYVAGFANKQISEDINASILDAISNELDCGALQHIGANVWDLYSCVDVELMIEVLRQWLRVEPASKDARHTLGAYLLAHGPDWDDEAIALLQTD